ncbi:MAG: YitT family protein [Erysipelotrichaceae bacterium]|nr:YitT family protein [Erysipelotrichaceae bacterium]
MMKKVRQLFMIEVGTFLFAFAIGMFVLPGNILSGGVAGITNLFSSYVPIDEDIMTILINTFLFVIGSIFLGKEFFLNTLVYSASYPVMLLLVTRLFPVYEIDTLLAALYGGLIGGIGVGIIFRNGGSSGGTDALALILEKYFRVKVSRTIMVLDALTVIAGLFIYGMNEVLIGLISVYLCTTAMERTMNIYNGVSAQKFEIISDQYEIISKEVHEIVKRGTTIVDIEGGYTGDKKKMLVVVVSEDQYEAIREIIDRNDPNAFVIISETKDVNGEGFTYEVRM